MPPSKKRQQEITSAQRALEAQQAKRAHFKAESTPDRPDPPSTHPSLPLDECGLLEVQTAIGIPDIGPGARGTTQNPQMSGREQWSHPPTAVEAEDALERLNAVVKQHRESGGYTYTKLDRLTSDCYSAMTACLRHFLGTKQVGFIEASKTAAEGQGHGNTYARRIRSWIRTFIDSGALPKNERGYWNVSVLDDEDVGGKIKMFLLGLGKYACAADVVRFLSNSETQAQLGLTKGISIRTAQRWFSRAGYRWRSEPKGQYFDGHERADVVAYRQTKFLPMWQELERRAVIYNKNGEPDPSRPLLLQAGEARVTFWNHDECIFQAHDRRKVRWVSEDEHATPSPKGEGLSMMASNYVSDKGWLCGSGGETARVVLRPGKNRDGYFTNDRVVAQLRDAIKIAQATFPNETHVFVYDNAPSHTKRPPGSISARNMPKGPSPNFTFPSGSIDSRGNKITVRMEDGKFPDGSRQPFYFPDDHPQYPGWFKGMAQILRERGLPEIANKRSECHNFKCDDGRTDCCCRRALFCQPDFQTRDSILEEVAREMGSQVIFLPKYHCELNPIEQCWGYAKRKYRDYPPSSKESVLERNMLAALESVPLVSIKRFIARSQRFIEAYATGKTGSEAVTWVTRKFKGHRQTPAYIPIEMITS